MGEVILSAFLQVLLDRLAYFRSSLFPCVDEVRSELNQLKKNLLIIQQVLTDAEEKQVTNKAVESWLHDLQDLAYDVEDVLDEFATEALKRTLVAEQPTRNTTDYLSSGMLRKSMIEKISVRLDDLWEERNNLGLTMTAGGSLTVGSLRPPSTCVPTEPAVIGRDEDKVNILEMLLANEPSEVTFRVISIVGMGGIGKTTLAQEIYNDYFAQRLFSLKAWICVSDDFDVLRISKALLESITGKSCDFKDLNEVQVQLRRAIAREKFLLVLDDVLFVDYGWWQILKSPLMDGDRESRIIVTTRNIDVALKMGHGENYSLKILSDDDCWTIFKNHVSGSRVISALPNSELIREKVVQKCRGLPLAARTLGGLLRDKQRAEDWVDILDSKLWELSEKPEILPVLKLSYYHLPSHLKRCFAYCSIFPKNYKFERKQLVHLWMAQGYIQPSKNKQLEDMGVQYFHDLLSRSLFQHSGNDHSVAFMHDLIHDLAQSVAGDTIFMFEDELGANMQSEGFEKVRHFSCITGSYDSKSKFQVLPKVNRLRTFLPMHLDGHSRYISDRVISDLLPKLERLRALSLTKYHITELPNSIGCLRHLRYLNLSNTQIRSLPDSVISVYHLETLLLKACSRLMKLPSQIRNLTNLRHLDITGVNLIREMPLGMKELKQLRTLSNFIVGKDTGSGLKELKNLKFLCGKLYISGLENVISSHDAREALLSDKKDLKVLLLQWGLQFDYLRNEVVEKDILAMLQPHRSLKELTIKCYGGKEFPSWLGDPSFSNMVTLKLESCRNCASLPSFGLLGSLKDLTIKGMTGLKRIGPEIYGDGCSKPFQALETLCFMDLNEWEHWDSIEENDYIERFPRLRELSIVRCNNLIGRLPKRFSYLRELSILRCSKLSGRLPDHLPSLEKLVIYQCLQLVVSFSSFPMLCKLEIDGCKEMVCSSPIDSESMKSITLANIPDFGNWLKQEFHNVEHLKIVDCEELLYFWQKHIPDTKQPQGWHSLMTLKELCLENFPSFVSFPEVAFFSYLSVLEIENCNALISLPEGIQHNNACLERLRIGGCHSLRFIVKGKLPSSLKQLEIKNCEKLQCLLDDKENNCGSPPSSFSVHNKSSIKTSSLEYLYISECPSIVRVLSIRQQLVSLKHLEIWNCSKLTTLTTRGELPETLQRLDIVDCPKLELIAKRFHNNTSLGYIKFCKCRSLKFIPEGLHNLSSLNDIYIWDCPNLVLFPEEGLPKASLRTFSIERCKKLKALPNHMHNLKSLHDLQIRQCPNLTPILEEGFPSNLESLLIADLSIYKPLFEWGLEKLASLRNLEIRGCPYVVSFPQDMGMMLPTSLTRLTIARFQKLEVLSSEGLQNLLALEYLSISDCPNLKSFPEVGLPSSLLQLSIYGCPLLKKQCKRNEGQDWSKIAHIPRIRIDGIFIYDADMEEEE